MRVLDHLRTTAFPVLMREALWRTRRQLAKRRIPALLEIGCDLQFRRLGYHRPELLRCTGSAREAVIGYADLICQGNFPFLGYGTAQLGFPPPWNTDFVSGTVWPYRRTETMDVRKWATGADVKVPWELSRLQFAPVLAKAHLLTKEERYRRAALDLVLNWIQENPVGYGVNWAVAMEAALRGISICFLVDLLWPMRAEESAWLATVTKALWHHLLFIEAHSEFSHLVRSNHYVSNLLGLFCLSLFLDGRGMQRRRTEYQRKIENEIVAQVWPDGGDKEGTTGYHCFVMEIFSVAFALMATNGTRPGHPFVTRLRRMYSLAATLAGRSGEMPQIGDCDDGRVELRNEDLEQMVYASVPERNSLKVRDLLEHCSTALGVPREQSDLLSEAAPAMAAQVFRQSGIAVARTRRAELFFLAMRNGLGGKGSHTHNDKLSVVLRVAGQELLCDSGTRFYTRDTAIRNRFRSTAAHNTVMVNAQEQNRFPPGSVFQIMDDAEVTPIAQAQEGNAIVFHATHFGYRRFGIVHTRHVRLLGNAVELEDELIGRAAYELENNLHLADPWRVLDRQVSNTAFHCVLHGPLPATLTVSAPVELSAEVLPTTISRAYGAETAANRIRVRARVTGVVRLLTRLEWGR